MRRAKAFAEILDRITIYVEEGMLIIGNQASNNFAAPAFPNDSFNWIFEQLICDKRTRLVATKKSHFTDDIMTVI